MKSVGEKSSASKRNDALSQKPNAAENKIILRDVNKAFGKNHVLRLSLIHISEPTRPY